MTAIIKTKYSSILDSEEGRKWGSWPFGNRERVRADQPGIYRVLQHLEEDSGHFRQAHSTTVDCVDGDAAMHAVHSQNFT
jgi:hypothetical protein